MTTRIIGKDSIGIRLQHNLGNLLGPAGVGQVRVDIRHTAIVQTAVRYPHYLTAAGQACGSDDIFGR